MFSLPFIVGGGLYDDRRDDLLLGGEKYGDVGKGWERRLLYSPGVSSSPSYPRGSTFPTSPIQLNVCPSPNFLVSNPSAWQNIPPNRASFFCLLRQKPLVGPICGSLNNQAVRSLTLQHSPHVAGPLYMLFLCICGSISVDSTNLGSCSTVVYIY